MFKFRKIFFARTHSLHSQLEKAIIGTQAITLINKFKMVKLTVAQRNRAVGMLQAGMSARAVARTMNCCHSTILRLWQLFQQRGNVQERPRTGRPRVTTPAQDRWVPHLFKEKKTLFVISNATFFMNQKIIWCFRSAFQFWAPEEKIKFCMISFFTRSTLPNISCRRSVAIPNTSIFRYHENKA